MSSLEVCNECLDCILNDESDHEKVRYVAALTAYIHCNNFCNEMNADATEKFCHDEEITSANVKDTEIVRNAVSVRWMFSVLVLVSVLIGIAVAAIDILSIYNAWFSHDDLNVVFRAHSKALFSSMFLCCFLNFSFGI